MTIGLLLVCHTLTWQIPRQAGKMVSPCPLTKKVTKKFVKKSVFELSRDTLRDTLSSIIYM